MDLLNLIVSNFTPIAVFLLTAAFGAHFIWRNNYKVRRANACAAFRATINKELGAFLVKLPTSSNETDIDRYLKSVFPTLDIAVREFRNYVPWWQRWSFDKAWVNFYNAYPGQTGQHYVHYMASFDPSKSTQAQAIKDSRDLFHKNVNRLLSYANET